MLDTTDNLLNGVQCHQNTRKHVLVLDKTKPGVNPTQFFVEERVIFEPNLFYDYKNIKLNAYLRSFYRCFFVAFGRHFRLGWFPEEEKFRD